MPESAPGYSALWKVLAVACVHYGIAMCVIYLPHPIRWAAFGAGLQLLLLMIATFGRIPFILRLPLAGALALGAELIGLAHAEAVGGITCSLSSIAGCHLMMSFGNLFFRYKVKVLTSLVLHAIVLILVVLVAPLIITIPEIPENYRGESIIGMYFTHNATNPAFYCVCVCVLGAGVWVATVTADRND